MIKYDEQFLADVISKWSKRLGLSDWTITACFREARDMHQAPANTRIRVNIQQADIHILQPEDRQLSDPQDADMELDIVHELIHIRLWAIDPEEPEGVLYACREQAIEWLAKALITSDRSEGNSLYD
jgi:hypothetical protein